MFSKFGMVEISLTGREIVGNAPQCLPYVGLDGHVR
jgi:hypothetical protein